MWNWVFGRKYGTAAIAQRARFTWPTWGPPGPCRPQLGPMLAPWTLLSGWVFHPGNHIQGPQSILSFNQLSTTDMKIGHMQILSIGTDLQISSIDLSGMTGWQDNNTIMDHYVLYAMDSKYKCVTHHGHKLIIFHCFLTNSCHTIFLLFYMFWC